MNFRPFSSRKTASCLFVSVLFLWPIFGSVSYAEVAQKDGVDAQSQTAVMQALLTEVRLLRQAVEHMAAVNARAQIILQQMQLQERRLNTASAHLNDLRKQIATLSDQQAQLASDLQGTEARLGQEGDPERLRDLQQRQSDVKNMMERLAAREAQLRPQEADAAMLVQNEQNKWQDLSDQLSTLIQGLGPDAASAQKPQAP